MKNDSPKTLQQAIVYFSNQGNCLNYLVDRRWPNGVICPTCGRDDVSWLVKQSKWQCKSAHIKRQFSIKTGTIFEDSPLGLDKWLTVVWMIVNCKNGVSSYEIHRAIGVTQKSAWFMVHRIRLAMQTGSFAKQLSGEVEVDETYIGGKSRFMHKSVRERRMKTASKGKVAVMGLLERKGEVRTMVIQEPDRKTLHGHIKDHIAESSHVFTDGHPPYLGLDEINYIHSVINHAEESIRGNVHTQCMDNYWSLLKRTIKGTYVCVEPFYLFRHLDEQAFRSNMRETKDGMRFHVLAGKVDGKRLTYKELTGKTAKEQERSH